MTGWIEPSFFSVFFVVSSTLAQLQLPIYFLRAGHLDSATVVKACSPGTLAMVL
jgi:hypothetical protein